MLKHATGLYAIIKSSVCTVCVCVRLSSLNPIKNKETLSKQLPPKQLSSCLVVVLWCQVFINRNLIINLISIHTNIQIQWYFLWLSFFILSLYKTNGEKESKRRDTGARLSPLSQVGKGRAIFKTMH